jgi:glycogen debranching enzyme
MSLSTADLSVSNKTIDRAIRIAIGDLVGNINLYKDGLLEKPARCLMAGLDYNSPWTRDAAFNTWYGLGLLAPEVAKNTLLSVLRRDPNGEVRIGGEYWDAIIWAQGVWQYYLYTGDRSILETAHAAVKNSLHYFEQTEFDPADGLFRGGACFQDGIAAYPDFFAPKKTAYTGILGWLEEPAAQPAPVGVGIICKALSTNCLYFRAYQVAGLLAMELGQAPDPAWEKKAESLHRAINDRFWREDLGRYGYLVDAPENDDYQEGLGLAFALLFGVASDAQAERIFETVYLTPHGIACVWPTYPRYRKNAEFGRHSGTIWPQVNAAWALACHARGRRDLALHELELLAKKACRDSEFVEVYHPETGVPYGGLQEALSGQIESYWVCHRQSWCASGYLAMVIFCLFKLEIPDNKPLSAAHRSKFLAQLPKIVFGDLSAAVA